MQFVQTLGAMPFLFMTFFSSTFSPSAGVDGLKAFRFLFPRFYMWCRLPDVKDDCPAKNELTTYTILSGCLGLFLSLVLQAVRCCMAQARADKAQHKHEEIAQRPEYQQIQAELYKRATNKIAIELSGRTTSTSDILGAETSPSVRVQPEP